MGVERRVLLVLGMRDNGCRERVIEILSGVEGVCEVDVSLVRARATVVHEARCEIAALVGALALGGFGAELVECEGDGPAGPA